MITYLQDVVGDWSQFKVALAGTYLGFRVGPDGGVRASWAAPLAKFRERAHALGAAGLAPSLGCRLYARNVSPVLSYVEQLCEAPPELRVAEQSACEKLHHAPHNMFSGDSRYYLQQSGLMQFGSLAVRGTAARIRTALSTCTAWRREHQLLTRARLEDGPGTNQAAAPDKLVDFPNWSSRAFADVLFDASRHWAAAASAPTNKGLQAAIAKKLAPATLASDLAVEMLPRLRRFLAPLAFSDEYLLPQLRATLDVVRPLAPSIGWALVRTWANGWITTSRTGTKNQPCCFGCPWHYDGNNTDRLDHYVT